MMTKSELRKARKAAVAAGLPLTGELALDRGDTNVEFGPEHLRSGRVNVRRANALYRHAKFVYDYDRD